MYRQRWIEGVGRAGVPPLRVFTGKGGRFMQGLNPPNVTKRYELFRMVLHPGYGLISETPIEGGQGQIDGV